MRLPIGIEPEMGKIIFMPKGKLVYIAAPYSEGDQALNVRLVLDVAQELLMKGHFPFVPHLFHFWHMIYPNAYDTWIALDKKWLERSDCVLRLPGYSVGADAECKYAAELGLPIYYSPDQTGLL